MTEPSKSLLVQIRHPLDQIMVTDREILHLMYFNIHAVHIWSYVHVEWLLHSPGI